MVKFWVMGMLEHGNVEHDVACSTRQFLGCIHGDPEVDTGNTGTKHMCSNIREAQVTAVTDALAKSNESIYKTGVGRWLSG